MPQPTEAILQHCLARALYDNIPDSPDELQFKKDDTLIVLEQNTANIEGWWLCSLRGRQGICPANRLRLIPGVFENPNQLMLAPYQQFCNISGNINFLQKQGKRRSWHVYPNQVITPKKFNDVYLYDMPVSQCFSGPTSGLSPHGDAISDYDVPPRATPVGNDNYRICPRCSPVPMCTALVSRDVGEAYDVPRSLLTNPNQLTPSSSASSLTADSVGSSNRSSLANMPDYDVPRSHHHPIRGSQSQTYDVPSHVPKELPLELNFALENLDRLQMEATSAISRLLGFAGPQWRTRDRLEANIMEIRLAVTRLKSSLYDLAEFGEGSLGNAARASDKNIAAKLAPLVTSLWKSYGLVQEMTENLNKVSWSIDILFRPENYEEKVRKPDELEQLVTCARSLTEDIRQIASYIQGNGLLLFKQSNEADWPEENNYVCLDTKETVSEYRADITKDLPEEMKMCFERCAKHADDMSFELEGLDSDDRRLLAFYAAQVVTHHANLTHAIDAFLHTVEHNQPPKIFLAHGKFVVLSAHKLVLIGDTVHRNIVGKEIRERAMSYANALSEALATSVTKTKQAALQFPSVNAVQEMVDSVVDISHSAKDLKVCLVRATIPL